MGTGVPDALVLDQDPKFRSQFFLRFVKKLGASLVMSTAEHPNAKVEHINGVLGDTLRAYSSLHEDDWNQWIPYVCFAINNAPFILGCRCLLITDCLIRSRAHRCSLKIPHRIFSG